MNGQCQEMPAEEPNCPLIKEVKIDAYKVEELGGMIFAYMGPARRLKQPPAYGLHLRTLPFASKRMGAKAEIQIVGQHAYREE